VYRLLNQRISIFTALLLGSLDQLSLQNKLQEIGDMEGATTLPARSYAVGRQHRAQACLLRIYREGKNFQLGPRVTSYDNGMNEASCGPQPRFDLNQLFALGGQRGCCEKQ
jgi:hypothetical protein